MEAKINIANLLKDCPKGMELDCTMIDNVVFEKLDVRSSHHPIIIRRTDSKDSNTTIHLTKYGQYSDEKDYKCVIFPKGKTTWEGFHRPFKDGDIVFYNDTIAIFKEWGDETLFRTYVTKYLCCDSLIDTNVPLFGARVRKEIRLATEEEKAKLFDAIKSHGYKWNPETKTLESVIQPKFKVGDKVVKKDNPTECWYVQGVGTNCNLDYFYLLVAKGKIANLHFKEQDDWELVPNKFDVTTLKPFDKVLMRSSNAREWVATFYSHYSDNKFYGCGMCCDQCIPYEGNEHLRGTPEDCDEYYKTWE